jgi:hypothetical protein
VNLLRWIASLFRRPEPTLHDRLLATHMAQSLAGGYPVGKDHG